MDSGPSLKPLASDPTAKPTSFEEEKVSNIVEICNVSRDEAVRVLDACHMDETMAIDRFLNGTEVSTWSQVSKKKRQTTQSRATSGSRAGHGSGPGRAYDRDREVDLDRKDRDRTSGYSVDHSNTQNGHRRSSRYHGHSQRSRDHPSGANKKRNPQNETKLSPPPRAVVLSEQTDQWVASSNEENWIDPGVVNGVAGESWSDNHAPSTDPWSDKNSPEGHAEQANGAWNASSQIATAASTMWQTKTATESAEKDTDTITEQDAASTRPSRPVESPPRQSINSLSTVKRTFNYAAAAAAGTSHEKSTSLAQEISPQISLNSSGASKQPISEVTVPDLLEDVVGEDVADSQKRRSRSDRKHGLRVEGDVQSLEGNLEARQASESPTELYESQRDSVTPKSENLQVGSGSRAATWATPSRSSNDADEGGGERLKSKAATRTVTPAGVMRSNESTGDSLSLQFGSFGLGGLDGVNWSASEQKSSESVVNAIVSPETTVAQPAASMNLQPNDTPAMRSSSIASESNAVEVSSTSLQTKTPTSIALPMNPSKSEEVRTHPSTSSSGPLSVPSSGGASGVVPMLPVGPGGNFAPASYAAPYLMPPLHGYSPAMTSYENGGDLGSSRAPSLVPSGSLPMYDPTTIPGMPAANGKYGGIPGLGDMSGLQGVQPTVSKDGQHGNPSELEKSSSVTSSGLPAGMDPLAPPYMMPGYPSMQYPMYTFPTGPYAPPGMAPPGPSPFPYPPPGQVSSQGGRAGFGFEDAPIGLSASSRAGSALAESMYTPGYLNASMTHSSSQKGSNDGSFKAMRATPASGMGGANVGGGMVPGMAYGDYPSGIPVVSNGVGSTSAPGNWNSSRQHSGGRSDSGNTAGIASNQAIAAASPGSNVYTPGPGTHGGYWGPQQGGYYQ